eukprot:TRINITY_DN13897_c0_g1_i1.p1 TRINITY_DN13897_c0_g1~~TRINITY_DN13897_c0_g1_i1.p1  ORF type:complete len:204 (-),score=35.67 TRINITY_DN13897_c0_g1_i1:131-742(-)
MYLDNVQKSISSHGTSSEDVSQQESRLPTQTRTDEDNQNIQDDIVEEFPDGSRYEGKLVNGVRHGNGKLIYPGGGYYVGEWNFGKMEGFGQLYYPEGILAYEGKWQDDKFHGKGVLFNDAPDPTQLVDPKDFSDVGMSWSKYEGEFWNDGKEGSGICYFADGSVYEGKFKKDCFEGEGIYKEKGGRIIHGIWLNNKLVKAIEE